VYDYQTFTESVELDVHVNFNLDRDTASPASPGANGFLESILVTICGMQSNYSNGLSNTTGAYTVTWDHTNLPDRICLGAYQYALYRREENPDILYSSNINATKMYGSRDSVSDFCGALVQDTRYTEACNVGYRTQTYFYPAEVITVDSVAISNVPGDTWVQDGASTNTSNAFSN
jgi:hypothetical protein